MTYNHQDYINSHKPKPAISLKPGDWVTANGVHRQLIDNFMEWLTPAHKVWIPKVGDWICNNGAHMNGLNKGTFKVDHSWLTSRPGGNTCRTGKDEDFYPWQPTKGEWCWFWTGNDIPVLGRFEKQSRQYFSIDHGSSGYGFAHCEPFIGTLPSHLKDN